MRRPTRQSIPLFVSLSLLLIGVLATPSQAEFTQGGNLLVSFDAAIAPTVLPRDRLVPIKAGFAGTFESLDASDTPALRTMEIRLSRGGVIHSQGLPRCTQGRLRGLSTGEALAVCRGALVGEGMVRSAFRFPDGKRARAKSRLLLFNAPGGLLMHLYTTKPLEGTFLVPMKVHRRSGEFATVLEARFPEIAAGYGFLTGFEMVIDRTYTYRGRRQSYLLASCPAPRGLSAIDFELARFTYRFEGAPPIRNGVIRRCKVKG